MSTVVYAVEIAIALGLLIFVHELGHFLAAKAFGVWVRRFAIGFGPPIVKWQRGDTEYSLRILPLGGFVEPMGDHPDSEGGDDPRALWRRPAWQRATVFAAGVVMNGVLALVLFTAARVVGMEVPVPVVGGVIPNMPAEKAGFLPGDRVVRINGSDVESFEDLMWTVGLRSAGSAFDIEIERTVNGAASPQRLTKSVVSMRPAGAPMPMIGVEPESDPVIAMLQPGSLLYQTGLRAGDRILAVNGAAVGTWRALAKALKDAPAGPVTLTVKRNGQPEDLRVVPADLKIYEYGMVWPTEVADVEAGSPGAAAGILAGDRIAAVQDKPWPTSEELVEAVKAAGENGTVRLTLWRGGRLVEVAAKPTMLAGADHPRIGIAMGPALGSPLQIGPVDPGGPAEEAGLRPGDLLRAAGESAEKPGDWSRLTEIFLDAGGNPIPLKAQRGDAVVEALLKPKPVPQQRLDVKGAVGTPSYVALPRLYNPLVAAHRGFGQTFLWLGRVYANLRQLLTGQVSRRAMAGPVGIVQVSLGVAAHGAGTLMNFWGMLSVFIGALNFLPIPPFDGGHVLFVLLEKIKGSPIGVKVRTYVWGAGWVAVLILFVLVTWQDIARLL